MAEDHSSLRPRFGWATEYIQGEVTDELSPVQVQRRAAADSMRNIIESLTARDLPLEELEATVTELEQIAGRLGVYQLVGYLGIGTPAGSDSRGGFFDNSPVLGQANPVAPPLEMSFEDGKVIAHVTFGSAYEGPPGCVHGGLIAAAFDDVLGTAQSLGGSGGMTGRLSISYRSPTPLHQRLRFVGELERTEGRKIFTKGYLWHGDTLTAEAEGLFIQVDFARFAELNANRHTPE